MLAMPCITLSASRRCPRLAGPRGAKVRLRSARKGQAAVSKAAASPYQPLDSDWHPADSHPDLHSSEFDSPDPEFHPPHPDPVVKELADMLRTAKSIREALHIADRIVLRWEGTLADLEADLREVQRGLQESRIEALELGSSLDRIEFVNAVLGGEPFHIMRQQHLPGLEDPDEELRAYRHKLSAIMAKIEEREETACTQQDMLVDLRARVATLRREVEEAQALAERAGL